MDHSPGQGFTWSLRVRWTAGQASTVYARNNAFNVGPAASFREGDPHPSAVEYLLGALGADLVDGLQRAVHSQGLVLDGLEIALSGRLEAPLVYIGVIGEEGEPRLSEITGTLYVSTDGDRALLQSARQSAFDRSPVANTLRRSALISIELRLVD